MYDFNVGDTVIINEEAEGVVVDKTIGNDMGWYKCKLLKYYPNTVCQGRYTWLPFNYLRLKEN